MGLILGGENAWKVRKVGSLVVALHWINSEPALVIFPIRKPLGCVPYVLPFSEAHAFATNQGYPTPHCIQRAVVAAGVMGMDNGKSTIKNIVEAILDSIEDMKNMPPEREKKDTSPPLGVATLFQGGSKIVEGEVTEGPEADGIQGVQELLH
jgi:hypothetical protein